ncbi:hypothetical protein LJR074_003676 [Acidovorax sp. LjRoot74]|uniref:head-tail connector protein n=1 Tax=Acidovorax sp. LjRoot74 TaxID=3342337 RepID=UPI003ECCE62F
MPTIKITDATVEPLTLPEAKAHLREEQAETHNDLLITSLITVARQTVEDRLQRTLIETTWLRTMDAFPRCGGHIELIKPRVLSVEWVKYLAPDGTLTTLDPAAYELDPTAEPGLLMPAYGTSWPATRQRPGAVQVQYKAGYGTTATAVPKTIMQWIKLALTELYENRSRSAERPVLPQEFADGLLDTYKIWSV